MRKAGNRPGKAQQGRLVILVPEKALGGGRGGQSTGLVSTFNTARVSNGKVAA